MPSEVLMKFVSARTMILRSLSSAPRRRAHAPDLLTKLEVPDQQTFFGYYDKSPFGRDGSRILATVVPRGRYRPTGREVMQVGYFDLEGGTRFHPIGRTTTWCWQQGCRLQWVPVPDAELVAYNTMVEGRYGAVIQSLHPGGILRTLPYPLYDVCPRGSWGLSLNFSRLQRLRPGYGYSILEDETEGDPCPADDGVWTVDLTSGHASLILTLDRLARLDPLPSMEGAEHYVNHLSFNVTGDRLMLLHLWMKDGLRHSRLVTADRDGRAPFVLANVEHVSHYAWKSATELLAYSTHPPRTPHYHLYRDGTDRPEVVGDGVLTEDGHPSFSPDRRMILTDTYPDRVGNRRLLVYCCDTAEVRELARFFSPPQLRGELRCDLHPRWDPTGIRVCVDSAHDGGHRAMYIVPLDAADD